MRGERPRVKLRREERWWWGRGKVVVVVVEEEVRKGGGGGKVVVEEVRKGGGGGKVVVEKMWWWRRCGDGHVEERKEGIKVKERRGWYGGRDKKKGRWRKVIKGRG
ncbi:hypothetical protein Pmani_038797 [Petrolisthes manimaculis]|uniref:Uncharacterized protein n=1 Tax=Petrolisthes manimaculis TaxID=1843537 RepID=A0AAE1NEY9_9EUCA|nr:hypothetical protein Pmani_038797 [Petrolisthes manimaculis]